MQLPLPVIALLVVGGIIATPDFQCWNFGSTNEIRDRYLKEVNRLRSELAKGNVEGQGGAKCPAGKNIYRLVWDCILENEAQKVVDKCDESAKAPEGDVAMVIKKVPLDTCNPIPLFKKTVEKEWWNVVKNAKVDPNTAPTSSSDLHDFATLAHGDATRIGCAQRNCNGNLFMACMVYNKGPAEGQPIYEVGPGCSAPQDCTTYEGSKCNKEQKLCVAGYIDPTKTTTSTTTTATTTASTSESTTMTTSSESITTSSTTSGESTICKNQTDISSDPVRNVFKNQHNQLRSAVARGMVKMKDGIKCRNATQMWKLEYNCGLEASAHEAAKGCRKVDSTSKQFDEVWHVFDKAIPDMKDAAQRAIKLWYKEIETGYMNQTTGLMNMFLPELNIPHFARMIWDSHREIGCAVVKCTSATKVVCHYSPAVVRFGNTIYAMGGRTCNLCERMSAECSKVGLCLKRK